MVTNQTANYSVNEAASHLGVSPNTIREMIRRKELPAVKVGRLIRIDKAALTNALAPAVQ